MPKSRPAPKSHAVRAMDAVAAAKLPCSTKSVLYAICRRLNTKRADWCVWGGVRRIAREAGLAVSSAQSVRTRIVEMGIATVMGRHERQRDGWRGRPSTCLQINVEALERLAPGSLDVPATGTTYVLATGTKLVPATGTEVSKAAPNTQGSAQDPRRAGGAPGAPSASGAPEDAPEWEEARVWTDEQLSEFSRLWDELDAQFMAGAQDPAAEAALLAAAQMVEAELGAGLYGALVEAYEGERARRPAPRTLPVTLPPAGDRVRRLGANQVPARIDKTEEVEP